MSDKTNDDLYTRANAATVAFSGQDGFISCEVLEGDQKGLCFIYDSAINAEGFLALRQLQVEEGYRGYVEDATVIEPE